MRDDDIDAVMRILKKETLRFELPIVTKVASKNSPYQILISTIISLRTKDEVTRSASERLYAQADTPEKMITLSKSRIEKAIFPAGFYHTKAENILSISKILIEKYNSRVPDDLDELLSLKGVGRKTANLVITLGYNKPGICVDTHVHRISNRWGYVATKNAEETEFALRKKLPRKYWIAINDYLVAYGQNLCRPVSPHCSVCKLSVYCDKIDVGKSK